MTKKEWIKKPQNYFFILLLAICVVGLIFTLLIFGWLSGGSIEIFLSTINLFMVSSMIALLTLTRIKKTLNEYYALDKFQVERIGIVDDHYYFLSIRNKTNTSAKNCKGTGVFNDERSFSLAWIDPSYPKLMDVSIEEYLLLFFYKDKKLIVPRSSINSLMIFKDLIKNIDDNFKKVLKIEEKEINNSNDKAEKITKWPCEEDKFLFTDYKDQSLEVYISAENAKTHSIFFNSVDQIITALQEKQPILHDDPEFKELIKDYPGMKNNSKK